jgi:hypothetical protein
VVAPNTTPLPVADNAPVVPPSTVSTPPAMRVAPVAAARCTAIASTSLSETAPPVAETVSPKWFVPSASVMALAPASSVLPPVTISLPDCVMAPVLVTPSAPLTVVVPAPKVTPAPVTVRAPAVVVPSTVSAPASVRLTAPPLAVTAPMKSLLASVSAMALDVPAVSVDVPCAVMVLGASCVTAPVEFSTRLPRAVTLLTMLIEPPASMTLLPDSAPPVVRPVPELSEMSPEVVTAVRPVSACVADSVRLPVAPAPPLSVALTSRLPVAATETEVPVAVTRPPNVLAVVPKFTFWLPASSVLVVPTVTVLPWVIEPVPLLAVSTVPTPRVDVPVPVPRTTPTPVADSAPAVLPSTVRTPPCAVRSALVAVVRWAVSALALTRVTAPPLAVTSPTKLFTSASEMTPAPVEVSVDVPCAVTTPAVWVMAPADCSARLPLAVTSSLRVSEAPVSETSWPEIAPAVASAPPELSVTLPVVVTPATPESTPVATRLRLPVAPAPPASVALTSRSPVAATATDVPVAVTSPPRELVARVRVTSWLPALTPVVPETARSADCVTSPSAVTARSAALMARNATPVVSTKVAVPGVLAAKPATLLPGLSSVIEPALVVTETSPVSVSAADCATAPLVPTVRDVPLNAPSESAPTVSTVAAPPLPLNAPK